MSGESIKALPAAGNSFGQKKIGQYKKFNCKFEDKILYFLFMEM